jgi:hypothetical protein
MATHTANALTTENDVDVAKNGPFSIVFIVCPLSDAPPGVNLKWGSMGQAKVTLITPKNKYR